MAVDLADNRRQTGRETVAPSKKAIGTYWGLDSDPLIMIATLPEQLTRWCDTDDPDLDCSACDDLARPT